MAALVLASVLWGSTFVAVKQGLATTPASLLVAIRFSIAGLAMGLVGLGRSILSANRREIDRVGIDRDRPDGLAGVRPIAPRGWLAKIGIAEPRSAVWAALDLGGWLAAGYATQTIALQFTTAGRCAFLSALYVVLVPLWSGYVGRRVAAIVWLAIALAILGVALLADDGAPPNPGDLISILVAIAWTGYIWRIEVWADRLDPNLTAILQAIVVASLSWVWVACDPTAIAIDWRSLPWLLLIYLGACATGLTIWLQSIGQRVVPAPIAAVLYALEPAWAAFFAWLFLAEQLSTQGLFGAALVLAAALLSQAGDR